MMTKSTLHTFTTSLLIVALNMATVLPVAKAMAVTHRPANKALVSSQPTPARITVRMFQASQTLEVQYDAERETSARVIISNIIGKTVQQTNIELQAGENLTRVDVATLPQGTYIIQVMGNGWVSEARKFVKANP